MVRRRVSVVLCFTLGSLVGSCGVGARGELPVRQAIYCLRVALCACPRCHTSRFRDWFVNSGVPDDADVIELAAYVYVPHGLVTVCLLRMSSP